jgi:hypothetical protein
MALPTNFAPYAPSSNIEAVINRLRTMNAPQEITSAVLAAAGVPEAHYGRVLQSLEFLGLIDAARRPTPEFTRLVGVPATEFEGVLAEILRRSYAELFQIVDPTRDEPSKIQAQFQRYQPKSQTGQMAALFLGLCRLAGMPIPEARRGPRAARQGKVVPRSSPSRRDPQLVPNATYLSPEAHVQLVAAPARDARLHKLVSGMLDDLPEVDGEARWDADELERWLADLGMVLRRVYRIG